MLVAYGLTHSVALVRRQRNWVWRSVKAASEVSEGLAGRPTRARRRLRIGIASVVSRWIATPLQIEALTSEGQGAFGSVISEVLGSAITRVATLGPPSSVVATPFVARPLLHEVADAVSTVPEGRLVASVLQLLGRLVRRDELRLRGAALLSANRGPGLSLTLTRTNGDLIDGLTIWADEYEPHHAPSSTGNTDLTDRLMQVSTAAAVWTHFTILRFRLSLRDEDYRAQLGTHDWQSYAYLRTGARERSVPKPEPHARALFALAVDADPRNLPAQFNLAFTEALERDEAQAATRLASIYDQLEKISLADRTAGSLLSNRQTLDYDPFHFQVVSLWASVAINSYWRETRNQRKPSDGARAAALESLLIVWRKLTAELSILQAALAILDPDELISDSSPPCAALEGRQLKKMDRLRQRRDKRWRRGVLSRSDSEQLVLKRMLSRFEPPMLLRWAMMGIEIGRDAPGYGALVAEQRLSRPTELNRVTLTWGLHAWTRGISGTLTPHAVVEHFLHRRARLDGNARYELACYYAQTGDVGRSLEELNHSFGLGEHRALWSDDDPQLARVRDTDEYESLRARYSPS